MSRKTHKAQSQALDPGAQTFIEAEAFVSSHPLLAPLASRVYIIRQPEQNLCPADGYAVITSEGRLFAHPTRRASSGEWIYALAHSLLHLGFDHFKGKPNPDYPWNVACDCAIASFLAQLKLGQPCGELIIPLRYLNRSEENLYREFSEHGVPESLRLAGVGAPGSRDMLWETRASPRQVIWADAFAEGLRRGVSAAVDVAGGKIANISSSTSIGSAAERARGWFISSFPLLGALATNFRIVEKEDICRRMDISVAAVSEQMQEIYVNPASQLNEAEWRFVLAHELLHVGLRHEARRQGRDAYLWNVACDFVINGWLVQMRVGELPHVGLLHDSALNHLSAEAIYDQIVTDARMFRKLATLRGVGLGDVLGDRPPEWWQSGEGVDLDAFYRGMLAQGLEYYDEAGRGLMPAGLIEEIRALAQPPIAWDVALARWFDAYFPPIEKVRTYARPSRRQGSTPDIPRPRWVALDEMRDARTFGVVLDTSGSMVRSTLAKALGAIASYAIARDVPAARVIFCDALAYDAGYMPVEAIAEKVKVRGRGGTILQPGIDLLERAEEFPHEAPVLIITDGQCDRFSVRREHAFLLPGGANLPFAPRGPVFRMG